MKAQCEPKHVRFARLMMTVFIATYALFGFIEGMYIMLAMTISTILFSSSHSLSTLFFKFLNVFKFDKIFTLNPRYERSFFINRQMELFEEFLRLIAVLVIILLFHLGLMTASTVGAFYLAVMMLISTFFGFCMSSLFYIAYKKVFKKDTGA